MTGTTQPRLLFVGHDASRTGAPLLLLHFLRWLADNTPIPFEILLRRDGELAPAYATIAPTRVLESNPTGRSGRILRRLQARLRMKPSLEAQLRRLYPSRAFPLVYSNTVANGDVVGGFARNGHRVICHAHEMKFGISRWGGPAATASAPLVNSFIAASGAVKRDLQEVWRLPGEIIEVIHEFGQPARLTDAARQDHRRHIRSGLGIPDSAIVVGMCGTVDWRKGADLFPLLANTLRQRRDGAIYRFVWVGSRLNSTEHFQLSRDLEVLGLSREVSIIGEVADAQPYLSAFDVFALTSREDPCPLVMLEAAALGLPIVCFAQSGGAPDFVGSDAGLTVPYLGVAEMAEAVALLGADCARRMECGHAGKKKVAAGFSLESQAPKLLSVITRNFRPAQVAERN